jgi:hypothetical protein
MNITTSMVNKIARGGHFWLLTINGFAIIYST